MYNIDIKKIDKICMCVHFASLPQKGHIPKTCPDTYLPVSKTNSENAYPKKANSILRQSAEQLTALH